MKPIEAASEHFTIIHWERDSRVIEGMLEVLENSYNRITSFLQVELLEKCVLHVYPDISKLHEGIGRTGAPDWVAGNFDKESKIISIVSPNNPGEVHNYEGVMAIAVHELVHLAAELVNGEAPDYLSEGLATYLANQDGNTNEYIQEDLLNNSFPTMTQLKNMTDGVYQYGYAFVEYVVSEYGEANMLKLYKTADIGKTLNISEEEFHKKWKGNLISNSPQRFLQ